MKGGGKWLFPRGGVTTLLPEAADAHAAPARARRFAGERLNGGGVGAALLLLCSASASRLKRKEGKKERVRKCNYFFP